VLGVVVVEHTTVELPARVVVVVVVMVRTEALLGRVRTPQTIPVVAVVVGVTISRLIQMRLALEAMVVPVF